VPVDRRTRGSASEGYVTAQPGGGCPSWAQQLSGARVPGAAQHEVMRCRPGTAKEADFVAGAAIAAHLLTRRGDARTHRASMAQPSRIGPRACEAVAQSVEHLTFKLLVKWT
jgi:hypothetical protein